MSPHIKDVSQAAQICVKSLDCLCPLWKGIVCSVLDQLLLCLYSCLMNSQSTSTNSDGLKKKYMCVYIYICALYWKGTALGDIACQRAARHSVRWIFIFMDYLLSSQSVPGAYGLFASPLCLCRLVLLGGEGKRCMLLLFKKVTAPERISSITGTITLAQGIPNSPNHNGSQWFLTCQPQG